MTTFFGFSLLLRPASVSGVEQSPTPRRQDPVVPAAGQGPFGTLRSVSDFYREVILDHYKNPRGHGAMEPPDGTAEGLNPLCGAGGPISAGLADDGETIDEVKFEGRGCGISQAATSMLTEMV